MRYRKLRIAWSVGCFMTLIFLLPNPEPSRGANGQLVAPSAWFMPMLIGLPVLSVLPWIPVRFSLRALLITTTLVAVVLGLIVYAAR